MPNFSSLQSSLNGNGFFYEKSSRHAAFNFNQTAQALYRNNPRFPFEYYININLNNVSTAKTFISDFFNSSDLAQIMPLVKSVEMPSFKIESTPLNQYNRKRISQTKIAFEPIKMVFHDVADGKTLKFWEMYYRYYFSDGSEPGKNTAKNANTEQQYYTTDETDPITGKVTIHSYTVPSLPQTSTNTSGDKSAIQNIVSNTLDNHNFGFNLSTIENIRNLIQTIDIYQVHGGRFNQVTLVNPRISAFTHDTLNYAVGDKTLEITLTFDYEYAYYTIQNMVLGAGEPNNSSTIEQFTHGDFLELTNLSFTSSDPDFIQSNNPALSGDRPTQLGSNIQTSLNSVKGPYGISNATINSALSLAAITTNARSSSLGGLTNIFPPKQISANIPIIQTRPFGNIASVRSVINVYTDMNRTGGNP